jgi:hypothetical protein
MSALTRRQFFGRVGMSGFGSRIVASGARRTAVVLALVLPVAAWMIIPAASAASAACSPSNHCFAVAENLNGATNHGIYGKIYVHCLYQPNDGTFATNEMWDVDNSNNYWEEVGIVSGATDNGYLDRHWFWDDSRPGGGYHQHNSSVQANLDTSYRAKIEFQGNDTWYIYGNGNYSRFGTSTSQSATLIRNEAGTEYTSEASNGIRNQGNVGDLQRKSSGNTWYSWGSNAAPVATGYINASYFNSSSTVSWTGPC